jgi:hypothetical protein
VNPNFIFSLPAYHLAVVNVVLVALVGAGWGFYSFIYPRRQIHPLVLVGLLSTLPVVSFFRAGDFGGGLYVNTSYAVSFFQSLREGVLVPRWAGQLNTFYGYPAFNFLYPLPFYLSSFWHGMGFDFINSVKLVFVTSYLASGMGMYLWAREYASGRGAVIAAILYQFAPYRFVDMHFRLDVGESLAFVFMPLVFYALIKWVKQPRGRWVVIGAISTGLLILSHQIFSLTTIGLAGIYALFLSRKHLISGSTLRNLLPLVLGVGLAAFYWLPVLAESRYTHLADQAGRVYFPPLLDFLSSSWRWGLLFQGPGGEISPALGWAQWGMVLVALWALFRRGKQLEHKGELGFWLVTFGGIFILMQGLFRPLWQVVPGLKMFQFSWRLVGVEVLVVAALGSRAVDGVTRKLGAVISVGLVLMAVLGTLLNWGNRESSPAHLTDTQLSANLPLAEGGWAGLGEAVPMWVPNEKLWGQKTGWEPISLLGGSAKISMGKRTSVRHQYVIDVTSPAVFRENTNYFPGWEVKANGQPVAINYRGLNNPGIIEFSLPVGNYTVNVWFKNTTVRTIGQAISLGTLISLAGGWLFGRRRKVGTN